MADQYQYNLCVLRIYYIRYYKILFSNNTQYNIDFIFYLTSNYIDDETRAYYFILQNKGFQFFFIKEQLNFLKW